MSNAPLEVGSVYTRLGFKEDAEGAIRYERLIDKIKTVAKDGVHLHAGVEVNKAGFNELTGEQAKLELQSERLKVKQASLAETIAKTGVATKDQALEQKVLAGELEKTALASARLNEEQLKQNQGFKEGTKSVKEFGDESVRAREHFGPFSASIGGTVGALIGGVAGIGLIDALKKGVDRMGELEKASAQTRATLKTTGDTARVSAGHIDAMAKSLGNLAGQDPDQIVKGENLLLTYTNVANLPKGAGRTNAKTITDGLRAKEEEKRASVEIKIAKLQAKQETASQKAAAGAEKVASAEGKREAAEAKRGEAISRREDKVNAAVTKQRLGGKGPTGTVQTEVAALEREQSKLTQTIKTGSHATTESAGAARAYALEVKKARDELKAFGEGNKIATTQAKTAAESIDAANKSSNDIFDRTVKTSQNMSVTLGEELPAAIKQVGIALNNPEKGMTRLSKAGVVFTKGQTEMVKELVKTGHTATAQKFILDELEHRYNGSAKAAGKTLPAALERAKIGMVELLAKGLSPLKKPLIDAANWFSNVSKELTEGGSSAHGMGGELSKIAAWITGTGKRAWSFLQSVVHENRKTIDEFGKHFEKAGALLAKVGSAIVGVFEHTFGTGTGAGKAVRQLIKVFLELESKVQAFYLWFAKAILPGILKAFEGFAQVIRGVIKVLAGIVTLNFGEMWTGVKDIFSGAFKAILGIFEASIAPIVSVLGKITGAIGEAFEAGWEFALETATGFINEIIEVLDDIPFVNIHKIETGGHHHTQKTTPLHPAEKSRTAGMYAEGGRVDHPIAIMGEDAPAHPEWVIPTNPAYRDRAYGLWAKAAQEIGVPGFASGGLLSKIGGVAGKVAGAVGGVASKVAGVGVSAIESLLPKAPGGLLKGTFKWVIDEAKKWIVSKAASLNPFGGGGGKSSGTGAAGTAQMKQWAKEGLEAAGVPATAANVSTIVGRMQEESGGNPNIINEWDINAQEGHPSKGLMQTIPETFASYHVKGTSTNIFNPVANVAAAVKYMLARYGHLVGATGEGYAQGGRVPGVRFFAKGGKHTKKPVKLKATLSANTAKGISRSIGRGEKGIGEYEHRIQKSESEYAILDREYGMQNQEYLVENADGSTSVNSSVVQNAERYLQKVIEKREQIEHLVIEYRQAVERMIGTYKDAIDKLKTALKLAKGKDRAHERQGYREAINSYQKRIGELGETKSSLGFEIAEDALDLKELGQEYGALEGSKGKAAPAEKPGETPAEKEASSGLTAGEEARKEAIGVSKALAGLTPSTADDLKAAQENQAFLAEALAEAQAEPSARGGSQNIIGLANELAAANSEIETLTKPGGETVSGQPTAQEIAKAALTDLAGFSTGQKELFSTFGSNLMQAGLGSALTRPVAIAAGLAHFGVAGGLDGSTVAGRPGVTLINHFKESPADPHTWAQRARFQIEGAVG